ncbi:class I SAM-dependent methyltransferase [Sorangium sp. So ce1151]|uniref:class I SAM-dependent methyltransferase n=1 Tax=Sorangium sp. So ce1151 TaxID=3133332 RepID=UPI003F5E9210
MLERIWDRHRAAGLDEAAAVAAAPSPEELCYLAMLAFADERTADAAAFAARAAEASPGDPLFGAAAAHLARVAREGKRNVYVSAEGFAAFIRGGGNVRLYRETSAALASQYPEAPFDLLELGAGDGMALLPALTPAVRRVTVVEPAAPLLERCAAALSARGVDFEAFSGRFQDLAADAGMASRRWAVAQATFCLHAIAPAERPALLRWARDHCDLLLIAEFDAPRMDEPLAPDIARHVLERYREGLAEYRGAELDTVAQGFLMPVLFGYADRGATRTTFEHPIDDWAALLQEAGFARVERRLLHRYWWAPAWLLAAR